MYMQFLLIALLLMSSPAAAQDASYSTVVPDLPLMQGMTENAGDAVVFDKETGRIIDLSATSTAPDKNTYNFYRSSLAPLGWRETSNGVFERDGEKMTITVNKGNVRFSIAPKEGE